MKVFGGGAFGRSLGLDEVVKIGPHDGFSVLKRRVTRVCFYPGSDSEDRVKADICRQEESSHQEPNLPTL